MDVHINSILFEMILAVFLMIPLRFMEKREALKPVKKRYYFLVITAVTLVYYVIASFILHEWHETLLHCFSPFLFLQAFSCCLTLQNIVAVHSWSASCDTGYF